MDDEDKEELNVVKETVGCRRIGLKKNERNPPDKTTTKSNN